MMNKLAEHDKRVVWWEKSVEYTFIAEMVSKEMLMWVIPLAGNAESALSDAVLSWDDKLFLIEFKRDVESLKSERKKYTVATNVEAQKIAYENAKTTLAQYNGKNGHGLIFGEFDEEKLKLLAVPYWNNEKPLQADEWISNNGATPKDFDNYIKELCILRFAISGENGGATGSRSFVVGVGKNGKNFTLELDEYINLRPALRNELIEAIEMNSEPETPRFNF
ncbi:hypothetical protein [Herminiimonas aquatilis]|uniref:Uncharacterized protein n=1 Tax=Herminiimonas aquatilis TaxID=345342 RepID=A0ABW2J549_9BURK